MDWREKLSGRRVVASISGGKDSAAMSLWLTEQGIDHDRVFMDTGWEHEATYEYLRGPLTKALGPITELRSEGMAAKIRARASFPSRTARWCTEELKVIPLRLYLDARMEAGEDLVNTVGVRAAESAARAKLTEWEWGEGRWAMDCEVWRPILRWSEQEVIDCHTRHGLAPNPLYLSFGVRRVGCWPCVNSVKAELRTLAEVDPGRVDLIRSLEREAEVGSRERRAGTRRGPPAFFQSVLSVPVLDEYGDPVRDAAGSVVKEHPCIPIDEVIKWARTSRGGRQFELFAPEREAGCVRWGLCETATPEAA